MSHVSHEDRPGPASLLDLFVSFTMLSLQGFGGAMAVVQQEVVERKRWLQREDFVEDWAVAQIMPGSNVVNLSLMIGARYFGWPGALSALAGLLTVPLAVAMLMALVYTHYAAHPAVAGALRGLSAVTAGLVAATGLKLFSALEQNPLGMPACLVVALACFTGVALLHWPAAYVLFGVGGASCLLAFRRIRG
jgi:chromate transporter